MCPTILQLEVPQLMTSDELEGIPTQEAINILGDFAHYAHIRISDYSTYIRAK